jgi:hypothetical protein
MSNRCCLLASDALVGRAMTLQAWEACSMLGGCYSGHRDLGKRRWHVHGSHQKRRVVRCVDRLE